MTTKPLTFYPGSTTAEEQEVLESIRSVQQKTGYGEVRVTIKDGQVVAVRAEHIKHMRGAKTEGG